MASLDIKNAERLDKIISYVDRHFTDPNLTAEKVAKECFISSRILYKALESENISFKDYLTRKRLENVLELIVLRGYKLYTACMDSGFKDLSTFYRNFRKFYGMSAREYINKFPDALPRAAKEEIKLESGTTIELYENGELKVKAGDHTGSFVNALKELARAYLDLVNSGASTTILDSTKYIDYSNSNHIPSD